MMQIIKSALVFVFLFKIIISPAQSTFLPNSSREYHLLDRLDIKNIDSGTFSLFSTKPTFRNTAVKYIESLDSSKQEKIKIEYYNLSDVDRYNMDKLLMNNSEWLSTPTKKYNSKKAFLSNFFITKNNFYETNQKDFKLIINPVIQQVQSVEMNNNKRVYLNSKGLELRGLIGNKIGFYSYLTDNQENGPAFYRNRVDSLGAVPGAGFYKRFKPNGANDKGQDYFDYRGYITFKLAKLIDVQYGFDKNFIGNGYRSLFLSDISAPTLFLKLNTKIWKLNYQNLFMELTPTFVGASGGSLNEKKYAAMHHLGIQINDNINLGLFESIIFKRRNKFEFGYLVPVIFYRAVESGLGSADNALLGADVKINFAEHFQFYGQALLDEFKLSYFKNKNWGNKIGGQAGLKYIDVVGIQNLDLQIEWNIVRPYTYSHFDSSTTYTNYNQPLAHPLGANFSDILSIIKYQPTNKLYFEFKGFGIKQGLDSSKGQASTFGGNIFRTYNNRKGDVQQTVGQGLSATTTNISFLASYELRPNFFVEGSLLYRRIKVDRIKPQNTAVVSLGFRWNMNRKEIDY
jgi:hypothetical protein